MITDTLKTKPMVLPRDAGATFNISLALLFILIAQRYVLPPHDVQYGRLLSAVLVLGLIAACTLLSLLRGMSRGEKILVFSLGVFAALSTLSVVMSPTSSGVAEYLINPFIGAATFIIAFQAVQEKGSVWLFVRLLALYSYPFFIGFWQYLTGDFFVFLSSSDQAVANAVASVFIHPNVFGLISFVSFVMAVMVRRNASTKAIRLFGTVAVIASLAAIFLAQGRASVLGLLVFSFFMALFVSSAFRLFALIALLPAALILVPVLSLDLFDTGKGLTSLLWRLRTWQLILQDWQAENILFGYGSGWVNTKLAYWNIDVVQVHNDYILVVMQSGALAAFFYFVSFIVVPVSLLTSQNIPNRHAAKILLSFGLAVLVISLTENVYYDVTTRVIMWSLMGGLAASAISEMIPRESRCQGLS